METNPPRPLAAAQKPPPWMMAEVKFWIGIAAATILAVLVVVAILNPHPAPPIDECKLDEYQIHSLWSDTWLRTHDEAERIRMTKDWVRMVENMCRYNNAKAKEGPAPLPPELQNLAK